MAKKKDINREIKQPDIVIRTINTCFIWIKTHYKICIIFTSIIVFIVFCAVAYKIYSDKKDEKMQEFFTEGMKYYREYVITGSLDALNKSEGLFKKVSEESKGNLKALSKLYLGRIYYFKNKTDDAVKSFREAEAQSDAEPIKILAKKALDSTEKK